MNEPTVGSMFAGIEGIGLGLEQVGYGKPKWQAERDPYCRDVLRTHYPDAIQVTDVRYIDKGAPRVDVLTAGFPCQPSSDAGRREGTDDERWLWPEVARVTELLRPELVIVENVKGLRTRGLVEVLTDLARIGYDAEYDLIPAAAIGAPHRRFRFAIVAWPQGRDVGRVFNRTPAVSSWWAQHDEALPRLVADTVERTERLRALGNAVVPQWAEWVGRCWWAAQTGSDHPAEGRRGFPADAFTRLPAAGRLHGGKVIRLNRTVPNNPRKRLWPTPAADDAEWTAEALANCVHEDGSPARDPHRRLYHRETGQIVQRTLTNYARGVEAGLWPTPTTSDSKGSRRSTARTDAWSSNEGTTLLDAARLWPTPKSSPSGPDFARAGRERSGADDLATAVARHARARGDANAQLNPAWVEWLMGFPPGWTHPDYLPEAA